MSRIPRLQPNLQRMEHTHLLLIHSDFPQCKYYYFDLLDIKPETNSMHVLQNLTYSFKKHSLFNNRTNIDWLTLGTYLGKYNYEVVPAQKDGHCLIMAIRLCLERDHGMIFTDGDIKKLITYEVFQNNSTYIQYYDGTVLAMLRSLDRYIVHGIYSQQVVDIAVLAVGKILRVNMCIYKNQQGKAILYSQPCNRPTTCDVYLKFDREHYDSICSKNDSSTNDQLSFTIMQDDVDAFAEIGAFFHVTNPMDPINGGKLYFVPPANSADSECASILENSSSLQGAIHEKVVEAKEPPPIEEATVYVPGEEMLENGVCDFNLDIGTTEQEIEIGQRQEDLEGEDIYDMFAELDLSQKVPEEFQFEEENSADEDAVLDNSNDELENVTPLKPHKKGTSKNIGKKTNAKKQLHLKKPEICIDLTETDRPTHAEQPTLGEETVLIDITSTFAPQIPDDSEAASDQNSNINSDTASFLSDSSSSTSRQKPPKWGKVKLDSTRNGLGTG